ncbi:MAG: GNAT family N-acetyltransferase [Clostridia bacterium]|nr:GNAT family N-acetyltransferase [Clostridia bacterium]
MQIETRRLILREMVAEDFDALYEIFSDAETMQYYPAPFDKEKTRSWIARNQRRYAELGFGLWAVVLKETGKVIGDCGVTMQEIHGEMLPEIGYHIHKAYQRRGYATEAARACRDYVFEQLDMDVVYSYMKYTNAASCGVAMKNGMSLIEEYDDPVNTRTRVYAITREQWSFLRKAETERV